MHTKTIGDISEAMVIAAFLQKGFVVLKPLGDNQRYDIVIDQGGAFFRVQCKTGRLRNGAIAFNARSSYSYKGHRSRDYRGAAEFFGIYCHENRECYLVPVAAVGVAGGYLRVSASANGQKKGTRPASDYLVPSSATKLAGIIRARVANALVEAGT